MRKTYLITAALVVLIGFLFLLKPAKSLNDVEYVAISHRTGKITVIRAADPGANINFFNLQETVHADKQGLIKADTTLEKFTIVDYLEK